MIALILYADDAALPADSAEDLQRSASIFEDYCNKHRILRATPKISITVFHSAWDTGVVYDGDSVYVDGAKVVVKIYNQEIHITVKASRETK